MARSYWVAPVPQFSIADGNLNTFTTLADGSPAPPVVLPANMPELGSTLRLSAFGNTSSTATPTFLPGFYFGSGAIGSAAVLAASSAQSVATGASWPWHMEYEGRVRAVGTSGSIVGMGYLDMPSSLTASTRSPIPLTLALRTVTIDTTVASKIMVGCTCSASSASNIWITNQLLVELVS